MITEFYHKSPNPVDSPDWPTSGNHQDFGKKHFHKELGKMIGAMNSDSDIEALDQTLALREMNIFCNLFSGTSAMYYVIKSIPGHPLHLKLTM
jgi:hypothetical protein